MNTAEIRGAVGRLPSLRHGRFYVDTQRTVKSDMNLLFPLVLKNGEHTYPLWLRKKNCFLYTYGCHLFTENQKSMTFSRWICPKPSLLGKLFPLGLWDYFPIALSFSVCFKFESPPRAFCGVLRPPLFSANDLPLLCGISAWASLSLSWVWHFMHMAGGGWETSDHILLQRKIISWLMSSQRSDSSTGHKAAFSKTLITNSPTAENSGSAWMLVLLIWFVLLLFFFIPFSPQC